LPGTVPFSELVIVSLPKAIHKAAAVLVKLRKTCAAIGVRVGVEAARS